MATSLHISFELESPQINSARVAGDDMRDTAAAVWRALAPLIAGQPLMRLSRDGGKNYPERNVRRLTGELPGVPAAVQITGKDGRVATLCLDLDSSRGAVEEDAAGLRTLFQACGLRWIEDCSPSGGMHFYLPLAQRIDFTAARTVVEALARRFSSLDPGPHQSAKTGCIRVPGSPWKRGGYQELTQPFSEAYDVARRRNAAEAYEVLRSALKEELTTPAFPPSHGHVQSPGPDNSGMLRSEVERIARHGIFDAGKYPSRSEARQAVLASAAGRGWTLTDVRQRMMTGTWAGLAALYAKYSPVSREKTLRREWERADEFCRKMRNSETGPKTRRKNDTSQPNTQGGQVSAAAEHEFLRSWELALQLYERTFLHNSRDGIGKRFLLRAMLEAAHKKGSRFVEFGVRAYAIATGTHPGTVAKQLRQLASTDSLIRLAGEGRGKHADLYELVIPEALRRVSDEVSWRPGRVNALRPVFRELGGVAALVYESVERSPIPLTTRELAKDAGLSPTSAQEAVELLAAWNLITRSGNAWVLAAGTSLRTLAEYFGVLEEVASQIALYRRQRAAWHVWLDARQALCGVLATLGDEYQYRDEDVPHWPEDYGEHATLTALAL